jgi:predicted short-subunit dehydrogenase-like oxidoreductase (DUF2520 family)
MSIKIQKIAIIGMGKVAKNLAVAFQKVGLTVQIYVRNLSPEYILFANQSALSIQHLADIDSNADLYLICVSDAGIAQVGQQLLHLNLPKQCIIAHTAGGQNIEKLSKIIDNYGVFYPLQTFSEGRMVDFNQLAFCINASNPSTIDSLCELAHQISNPENVHIINEEQRAKLHVAAVFVNNFSNYLFALAQQFCQAESVDFNLLLPLMRETVDKIHANPQNISCLQTGAALRGDYTTIAKHSELLEKYPNWLQVYQLLTEQILAFYQK